jgi:hypothetical protein
MLILHVADIHFRHPECGTIMDPDRPYRTTLVRDAREKVAELGGKVDAILVGGDIAFRGLAEEYEAALQWLAELATATGCSLDDAFVVPGNHDVNRETIKQQATVRNAQQAVSSARPERRERELLEQFRDSQTGPALLSPLEAYNRFAARFNCQVYAPDKLFWHQERSLSDGYRIRFYGLTSTLLSGAGAPRSQEDTRESLYLSPYQTVLDPIDGVVNLVICHHPPDWFMDRVAVDDAIRGRAALHLFGHEHRQRLYCDTSYVRFAAGAVNPDRNEASWEPGFNLIKVGVLVENGSPFLEVSAHLMCWQTNPERFRPKMTDEGGAVFSHRIRLRGVPAPEVKPQLSVPASNGPAPSSNSAAATPAKGGADGEVAMSEPETRNLVFRFWSLASSQRREIAQRLKLVSDDDMKLPEPERYGRALLLASERGLLDEVAKEIARAEKGA